jgi:hypothetical protein
VELDTASEDYRAFAAQLVSIGAVAVVHRARD